MDNDQLNRKANKLRKDILRTIYKSKSGHIGGSFSCIDILVALYHGGNLIYDINNPSLKTRDRFILSKGHAAIALYSVLADVGFINSEELVTFCTNGTRLGGHASSKVPGVEIETGSLGHGLGVGCGIAWGAKINKCDYKIIVVTGDAELYEGSIWEAIIFASHFELNNLVMIIDRNMQGCMDFTEECLSLSPLDKKLLAFGFDVINVDGHSISDLNKVLRNCKESSGKKPTAIIANTIKGKGDSSMEAEFKWHHSIPNHEEDKIALDELESRF